MDFAFAPGASTYDNILRHLLSFRPQTTVVSGNNISTINDFINDLTTRATSPAGTILIASHGSESAWMRAQLNQGTGFDPNTTYEALEQAATAPQSCQVAASVIDPRPVDANNNPITPFVFIKGCRIGKSLPFIQKFKDVVNGLSATSIELCAPKFYHVVYELNATGVFEYFEYDFHVYSRDAIATKADLVTALTAAAYDDVHGNAVPAANWNTWVPRNINRNQDPLLTVNIASSPVTNFATHRAGRYQFKNETIYTWTVGSGFTLPPANATQSDLATFMDSQLQAYIASADPHAHWLESSHPFPYYERFGYTSLNDMITNLRWLRNGVSLPYVGKRYDYHVSPPVIANNTNNELIYNFYANPAGSSTSTHAFDDNDALFFQTA